MPTRLQSANTRRPIIKNHTPHVRPQSRFVAIVCFQHVTRVPRRLNISKDHIKLRATALRMLGEMHKLLTMIIHEDREARSPRANLYRTNQFPCFHLENMSARPNRTSWTRYRVKLTISKRDVSGIMITNTVNLPPTTRAVTAGPSPRPKPLTWNSTSGHWTISTRCHVSPYNREFRLWQRLWHYRISKTGDRLSSYPNSFMTSTTKTFS